MRIHGLKDSLRYFPDIDDIWNLSDLDQTESSIRSKLPETGAGWNTQNLQLLTQLARVQTLREDLGSARQTLKLVDELLGAPDRDLPKLKIRALLEKGRFLCLSMQPVQAHDHFLKAWQSSVEAREDYFTIDAALMISINQRPKNQYEWFKQALAVAENTSCKQAQGWLPRLYMIDAWRLYDEHAYSEAHSCFEKALAYPMENYRQEASLSLRWGLGRTLRELKRCDEAMQIQKELLRELGDNVLNGHVHLEIGECLQLMGETSEAQTSFAEAHRILSEDEWFSDNRKAELDRIHYLVKKR